MFDIPPETLAKLDQEFEDINRDYDRFLHIAEAAYRISEGDMLKTSAVVLAGLVGANERQPREKTFMTFLAIASARLARARLEARDAS